MHLSQIPAWQMLWKYMSTEITIYIYTLPRLLELIRRLSSPCMSVGAVICIWQTYATAMARGYSLPPIVNSIFCLSAFIRFVRCILICTELYCNAQKYSAAVLGLAPATLSKHKAGARIKW